LELETVRASLQQAEDGATALQVEVDRLRDVERDLAAVREQLDRLTEERRLAEQRWKRVHRDLKEEVRRLHHRERTQAVTASQPTSPPSGAAPGALALPTGRSNSMTVASVSSLLRAATGNAASNGPAGRRTSIHTQQPAAAAAPAVTAAAPKPDGALATPEPPTVQKPPAARSARPASSHTRSSSNAGSVSSDSNSLAGDHATYESINVEYLRNVLFRFFNDKDRRPHLVPVLSNLLNCTTDDIKQIQVLLQ
ncbi:hypothetical protein H4R19_002665, partial [Coemansia spiralis]